MCPNARGRKCTSMFFVSLVTTYRQARWQCLKTVKCHFPPMNCPAAVTMSEVNDCQMSFFFLIISVPLLQKCSWIGASFKTLRDKEENPWQENFSGRPWRGFASERPRKNRNCEVLPKYNNKVTDQMRTSFPRIIIHCVFDEPLKVNCFFPSTFLLLAFHPSALPSILRTLVLATQLFYHVNQYGHSFMSPLDVSAQSSF